MQAQEKSGSANGSPEPTCLSFSEKFTYSLGQTAVSLSPALISSWLIYYYIGRQTPQAPALYLAQGLRKSLVQLQQAFGDFAPLVFGLKRAALWLASNDSISGVKLLLVSALAMSLGGFIPRFLEAFAEPTVGYYSDKWNFRMGRRIPWVVFGTPLLALFSFLIWFPPDAGGGGRVLFSVLSLPVTPNVLWLIAIHTAFWIMYTAVVAPYLSLLPEITPYNDERINVSMFMAYNDVAGSVLGSVGLGVMISLFASGAVIFGWRLDNAYKVSGLIIMALFVFCFYTSVAKVRERPYHEAKAVKFNFFQAFFETFKNPTFVPYVIASAGIRMSTDIILAAMPFMVTRIMGLDEGLAGILQGVIILGAAIFFPFVSTRAVKHGKKRVYLFGMLLFVVALVLLTMMKHLPILGWPIAWVAALFGHPFSDSWISFAHCIVTLAICALPVSIIFVMQRPILNDVMDYDEKLTGYRREAMYNGMEGLISKPASGIAYAIVPLMLKYLGDSVDRPWGVLAAPLAAAVIMFIAWYGFRWYEIEK